METQASIEPRPRPGAVLGSLAAALLVAGGAAWAVLAGERAIAGWLVAGCGLALVLGELWARGNGAQRLVFASSVTERMVDGALFGGLVWVLLPVDGSAGAAALLALSSSYIATYLRAKATGLGFDVEEPSIVQPARLAAVAIGLVSGAVEAGLWAAAVVGIASGITRSAEVAVRREAP